MHPELTIHFNIWRGRSSYIYFLRVHDLAPKPTRECGSFPDLSSHWLSVYLWLEINPASGSLYVTSLNASQGTQCHRIWEHLCYTRQRQFMAAWTTFGRFWLQKQFWSYQIETQDATAGQFCQEFLRGVCSIESHFHNLRRRRGRKKKRRNPFITSEAISLRQRIGRCHSWAFQCQMTNSICLQCFKNNILSPEAKGILQKMSKVFGSPEGLW